MFLCCSTAFFAETCCFSGAPGAAVEDAEWRISRNLTRAMAERGLHLSAPVHQSTVETIPDDSGAFCEMIFVPGLPNGSSDYQRLSEARCPSTTAPIIRHVLTVPNVGASLVEPARGVEGGGPEDEPTSGFTIAPLVRFCLMATFQGCCNTKEPQPLSRPVWLLPAQSKDGPVALSSALSGGYRGLSGRACTINHHRSSLVEPARGVEGGGPEDEPTSGFTIAPLVRFCLMATFQGRCNTKEPQPLSRPVWLLPAQSKDGPVALSSALSGGYRGLSGRACTINHHREQPA
ncbi:hypothetical protein MRX96_013107 [Rhipicephalus microplus]